MGARAIAGGLDFYTPALAMGVFERVGSNWFLDTIKNEMSTHNEPFRQQLHASHPLSSMNPNMVPIDQLTVGELHPYERYWLQSFVTSKYGQNRQMVKETNLFFAAENYLSMFPGSPAVVLGRNPVGIASSFIRSNLYERWRYDERYAQMQRMAQRPEFGDYAFLVEDDGATRMQKLGRLMALNTLLLGQALGNRPYVHVPYEAATVDRRAILHDVSRLIFQDGRLVSHADSHGPSYALTSQDTTFSTHNTKTRLETFLDFDQAAQLTGEVSTMLLRAADILPDTTVDRAASFLGAHDQPYIHVTQTAKSSKKSSNEVRDIAVEAVYVPVEGQPISWRNTHTTNEEFCTFLNDMTAAGIPNVINGTQLFMNENMLHERGGRIHFDESTGQYMVSEGYEEHPAYWVTWIGAASYALYAGARLPTRQESAALASEYAHELELANVDYKVGDAVKVTDISKGACEIHHPVGNVGMWCADGPEQADDEPLTRYMYGSAWNSTANVGHQKARPLSGNSRAVGIRLVRDMERISPSLTAPEIADRLKIWFNLLANGPHSSTDEAVYASILQ